MFEIGFPELLILCLVALLILGPQRMPEAIRTLGLWIGRFKRSFNQIKTEIEREVGMDDVRRQLHNESILEELKRMEQEIGSENSIAGQQQNLQGETKAGDEPPAEKLPPTDTGSTQDTDRKDPTTGS
jgi:sec-independent protein translocase protein TatB